MPQTSEDDFKRANDSNDTHVRHQLKIKNSKSVKNNNDMEAAEGLKTPKTNKRIKKPKTKVSTSKKETHKQTPITAFFTNRTNSQHKSSKQSKVFSDENIIKSTPLIRVRPDHELLSSPLHKINNSKARRKLLADNEVFKNNKNQITSLQDTIKKNSQPNKNKPKAQNVDVLKKQYEIVSTPKIGHIDLSPKADGGKLLVEPIKLLNGGINYKLDKSNQDKLVECLGNQETTILNVKTISDDNNLNSTPDKVLSDSKQPKDIEEGLEIKEIETNTELKTLEKEKTTFEKEKTTSEGKEAAFENEEITFSALNVIEEVIELSSDSDDALKIKPIPQSKQKTSTKSVKRSKRKPSKRLMKKSQVENKDEPICIGIELISDSDDDSMIEISIPKISATDESSSICPSYKVVKHTTFAVDAFKYGQIEGVTDYFLTHFHADHYVGLSNIFSMPIWASEITINIIREFYSIDEKLLNILYLNSTIHIGSVKVTAIDANHCPGGIMIFFQLPCGKKILHTGDFRATPEMELDPHLKSRNLDILYLDNTKLFNKYNFKKNDQSLAEAMELIRKFKMRHKGTKVLYVIGTQNVGHEPFWLELAKEFDFKVWADENRRKVLKAINNNEIIERLVENAIDADLHIVNPLKAGFKNIDDYWKNYSDNYEMIFAIKLENSKQEKSEMFSRERIHIVGIEYSRHSSRDELERFIQFLRPKEVISTVPDRRDSTILPEVPWKWMDYKKQASIRKYFQSS